MSYNVRFAVCGASATFRPSGHDLSAHLVLDMRADDVVECGLCLESEIAGALRIEALRPAGNDALDKFIRLTPDAPGDFVAGNTAQCLNLLTDRARYARHGKIDAWTELSARQACGMDKKAHRGARACVRVTDSVRNRQQGLMAGQRFPDDAREETGCRLIGLSRPHADGRQPDADAFEKTSARVVCKQQFTDCFL